VKKKKESNDKKLKRQREKPDKGGKEKRKGEVRFRFSFNICKGTTMRIPNHRDWVSLS